MVNVISTAKAAVAGYSAAIALMGNHSYPLPTLSTQVSNFFLPNYYSFSLGNVHYSPNRSVLAAGFEAQTSSWRENGVGTDVKITNSVIQPVSNESALCWLTYHIEPQNGMEPWDWINVYNFRVTDEVAPNGLRGGFEFNNQDNEDLSYNARFGSSR